MAKSSLNLDRARRAKWKRLGWAVLTAVFCLKAVAADSQRGTDWIDAVLAAADTVRRAQANQSGQAVELWEELERRFPVACDWMQQDFEVAAWAWLERPDAAMVRNASARVLVELEAAGVARSEHIPVPKTDDLRALMALYLEVCDARRVTRLRLLEEESPRIVRTSRCVAA